MVHFDFVMGTISPLVLEINHPYGAITCSRLSCGGRRSAPVPLRRDSPAAGLEHATLRREHVPHDRLRSGGTRCISRTG
ncbi:MAG: hypothetical protein ABSB32_05455 [Thermodesulfobacteriota bacterium]